MPDLTIAFEDLPLFQAGPLTGIYVTGRALVSYDELDASDWMVMDIRIEVDDSTVRGTHMAILHSDDPLFTLIETALEKQIEQAVTEATPYRDPNAEHRLSASQLGVGRLQAAE